MINRIFRVFLFLTIIYSCNIGKTGNEINKLKAMETKNITNAADTATFGGGCFWCIETIFSQLKGVDTVLSGYSGGNIKNPTYKEVCNGNTGHAEVVQIVYDSSQITFGELLEVFFNVHDPTTINQQGNDVGTQYRSAIFYHTEDQQKDALAYITQLDSSKVFGNKIVTEIAPFGLFYLAEDYHQNYFNQNGGEPYCQYVVRPKVDKFRKKFENKLK